MIRNPFRYSRPVAPAAFVGRWPAVHRLAADLTLDDGDSYALIGGRRCGKSSFLAALAHTLGQPAGADTGDWRPLPLAIDCAPLTITAPGEFLAHLLLALRRLVDRRLVRHTPHAWPPPVALDAAWFTQLTATPALSLQDFTDAVAYMLDQLPTDLLPVRLILLLDEVDQLIGHPWTEPLFDQLRSLVYSGPHSNRVRLVLAGSRRFIDEVSSTGSPLNNILERHFLLTLPRPGFNDLIARAPDLPAAATETVWQQSGGHPWLAQYLLHHTWRTLHEEAATVPPADLVMAHARKLQSEWAAVLEGWSQALEREGLRAYAALATAPDWLDESAITAAVADPHLNLKRGLVALCYHGLAIHDGAWFRYRPTSALWQSWFMHNCARLLSTHTLPPSSPAVQVTVVTGNANTVQQAAGNTISQAGETATATDASHQTTIDQRGQTIQGNQTNVAGDLVQKGELNESS
ncbi:MAG: AAA family ATPase [Caldilineaceae bacterium]